LDEQQSSRTSRMVPILHNLLLDFGSETFMSVAVVPSV